jgi:hypothetical protein
MPSFPVLILGLVMGLIPFSESCGQVQSIEEGSEDAHTFDRIRLKTGSDYFIASELQPLARSEITRWAMSFDGIPGELSVLDRFDLYKIYKNNNEWLEPPGEWEGFSTLRQPIPYRDLEGNDQSTGSHVLASYYHDRYVERDRPILGIFYRTPANLYESPSSNAYLKINPLARIQVAGDEGEGFIMLKQAGLRMRGAVDERIYFETELLASRASFPDYVSRYIDQGKALPGNGWYQSEREMNGRSESPYTFLNARGYIGFRLTPSVEAQIGHGRHFIGHGLRSLLLSNFSNNYFYLKLDTRIGKLYYRNIFASLSAISPNEASLTLNTPNKYMAAHYLGMHITPRLSLGLFEATILNRTGPFALDYLNPVILYHTISKVSGRSDKVLVGLNADWRPWRNVQFYGQFVADEFSLYEIMRPGRGWWGNQYGVQAGFKLIDFVGVDHLDIQAEFNMIRPYTFQDADINSNYTHGNLPLAHPLGANFREVLGVIRYQPARKWTVEGRYFYIRKGADNEGINFGGNLLRSSLSRFQDYNNTLGQGVETNLHSLNLMLSYELFHRFNVDATWQYRKERSLSFTENINYIGGGIRWNLAPLRMDF